MTEITQETVAELTASIQKSNEAISQMIDLMGEIGERLDASEQRFGNLVDLLKDQRSELPDNTSETNVNLVDLLKKKDQRSELRESTIFGGDGLPSYGYPD